MDISDLIHVGDLAGWTSQKNLPVRFTIKGRKGSLDGVLAAQGIDVREGINVGINGHVTCVSQRSDLPFEALKGVVGVIEIVTAEGRLRRIPALIKQVIRGQDDGSLSLYQFHVIDPLTLLRERITTRVFRRASVTMITDLVLNELRRSSPPLGHAFSVVMQLDSSRYPQYEFTLQHQESVADFLIRLWKRHGINFYFRPAENEADPPIELVLFDDSYLLPLNPFAGALRYHRLDGTEKEDAVLQWAEGSRLVGSRGHHFSHDYKAHHVNALAALLEDMRIDAPHAGDDHEDFMRQSQLRMSRHDHECNFVHGLSGSRDMAVGQYHEIKGHGRLDLRKKEEREFVITSIHHRAENNRKDIGARVAKLIKRSERIPGWACMEPTGDDQDPDTRHKYMNAGRAPCGRHRAVL
jgi:type VI secretion system secreted protein VgrG